MRKRKDCIKWPPAFTLHGAPTRDPRPATPTSILSSFFPVAIFLVIAYLAPIVLIAGLIFLGLPRLRPLGERVLRGGAAGALAGVVAALVIGLIQHHGSNGRGMLVAAAFGFTAAGIAVGVLHARQQRRAV